MSECLFCNIAAKKTKADVLFEDAHVVAFRDIHPAAPAHALVIPRKHLSGLHDARSEDGVLVGHLLLAARQVAEQMGLADGGYRVVINQGADGGQSVFHLHCHVLGGRALAWPPG